MEYDTICVTDLVHLAGNKNSLNHNDVFRADCKRCIYISATFKTAFDLKCARIKIDLKCTLASSMPKTILKKYLIFRNKLRHENIQSVYSVKENDPSK